MQEPDCLSPLQQQSDDPVPFSSPDLVVAERPFVCKLAIRGCAGNDATLLGFREALGIEPPPAGRAVEADLATVLPLGLTEWLAIERHKGSAASSRAPAELRDRLIRAGLVNVDVSSGTTIMRVTGTGLSRTMRRLSAFPLDHLPDGGVARTRMGRLPILLHRLATDRHDLYVARSYAKSFLHQLQDAAELAR